MNDAQLDHVQTFIQLFSLALMVLPAAAYIAYWIALQPVKVSNGRWRYWYTGYATMVALTLIHTVAAA